MNVPPQGGNTHETTHKKDLTYIGRGVFLASRANMPWHILVGVILSGTFISGTILTQEIVKNYSEAANKIIASPDITSGIKEVHSYACGIGWKRYICHQSITVKEVRRYEDKALEGDKQQIANSIHAFVSEFPELASVVVTHAAGISELEQFSITGRDMESIRQENTAAEKVSLALSRELQKLLPDIEIKLSAEGFQTYLSPNEIQEFQELLEKFGIKGELSVNNIQKFLANTANRKNIPIIQLEETQQQIFRLFDKYYSRSAIRMYGEKTISVTENTDAIVEKFLLFLLSSLALMIYSGVILPIVGSKQLKSDEQSDHS